MRRSMKKIIFILIAALLVLPLFSRGVTENVANEGIKGVATYLDSLDRVENDERIPEEVREELSKEVYRGRNLDEAVNEYLEKEEAERLLKEAEEARLKREAEAERIRQEYEAERIRKAEEAERLRKQAEAEAERLRLEAEAEAERIRLEEEAEAERLRKEAEEAERKEKTPVFEGRVEYRGISSDVAVYRTYATLTIPEGMSDDDFAAVLWAVCTEYPEETADVTYDIEGYTLVVYYPEQPEEFLLNAIDTLGKKAVSIIDLMYVLQKEESEPGESVAAPEKGPVVYDSGLVIESNGTIRTEYSYRDTLTASVVVEEDSATICYPSDIIHKDEIDTFMALFSEYYAEYVSTVYYDVSEDGKLVIRFDGDYVGGTYYRLLVLAELDEIVSDYIDTLAVAPIAEENNSPEEQVVRSVNGTFNYRGVNASFTVTETDAIIVLPEGVTKDDVTSFAGVLIEKYPAETSLVEYEFDVDTVLLHYPKQNIEYLKSVCEVLGDEAAALIDRLIAGYEGKAAETEKAAAAEEKTVSVPDVKDEKTAEISAVPSSSPVAAPVSEPVAANNKSVVDFDFDISLGLRGKFRYYKGDDHLYPTAKVSMRGTFFNFFYAEAGVDVFGYRNDTMVYIIGAATTALGLNIRMGSFDLFGYAEAEYLFTSKNSSFSSGMQYAFGGGLDWRISDRFIIGGGYEYQNGNHMFDAWVKFRF